MLPVQQHVQIQPMQYAGQPITIVAQPQPQPVEDKFQASAKSQMTVLCSIQIAMGILCVIFGITLAALDYGRSFNEVGRFGYGIWIGLYFVLVGGIGMGAVKSNTSGWIIATMALNIICTVAWCIMLLGFSSAGLVVTSFNSCFWFCNDNVTKNTFYAMDAMMLIMSIIQFVITIWCAALCCGAICSCCKSTTTTSHVVHYSNGYGHQTMYPSVPMHTYPGYPVAQTGITVQHGLTGVQTYPMTAYPAQAQPQGPPSYSSQSQAPPSYGAPVSDPAKM